MPSIKDLKTRIGSVRNTQKTTKAMKMVSAAKLRRAQQAITSQRPYARKLQELLFELVAVSDEPLRSEFIRQTPLEKGKGKLLLVLVTSDRGLCGGFNGNIVKTAERWKKQHEADFEKIDFGFIGKKGSDFCKSRGLDNRSDFYREIGRTVLFEDAKAGSQILIDSYLSGEYDEIRFIYNEFINAITQKVVIEAFLPITVPVESAPTGEAVNPFIVKPDSQFVFEEILKKHFMIQAYRILLESQAGEHGARMASMDSATTNAGDMIKKLTLQYNKQRQANITRELIEIVSGSEAQKG